MTITPFVRNRFTISAYLLLGFYAYMQGAFGPIMPFVRAELSLNYTVTGLHVTAFALGMVIAGTTGANVSLRIGRKRLFWLGGLGMCVGSTIFMIGRIAPLTIFGSFLTGWLGTYLLVMIQATLTDEHSHNSAIALTESNIMASLFVTFSPLIVGIGVSLPITWRLAMIVGIGIWILVFVFSRDMPFPRSQTDDGEVVSNQRLPRIFWLYWCAIFIGVALEWCTLFWSADFLIKVAKLPTELATTILSVFLFAIVVGRIIGSRLTRRYKPRHLMWQAVGLIATGFPLFWLGQIHVLNIIGLFMMGLGISNLFPFGLSIALRVGGRASDLASSRVSMGSGSAILIMPQILGSTADLVGIFNAFIIVPIFLVLLAIVLFIANRMEKNH